MKSKIKPVIKKEKAFLKKAGFNRADTKMINGFCRDTLVSASSQLLVMGITETFNLAGRATGKVCSLAKDGISAGFEKMSSNGSSKKGANKKSDKKGGANNKAPNYTISFQ